MLFKNRLRPGDIQIVAALGDALVSAQGALSTGITSAGKQYRGVSFATGESNLKILTKSVCPFNKKNEAITNSVEFD